MVGVIFTLRFPRDPCKVVKKSIQSNNVPLISKIIEIERERKDNEKDNDIR